MIIMKSDLTLNEVIRKMPLEDFKQWQQWIEDKGICERKECDRCHNYIRKYEERILNKR